MTDTNAKQEPEYSQRRLAGILAIAADAIISTDENQRITLFNKGAEQIFGYCEAETLGQPLEMLLPERFRTRHAAHVRTFGASSRAARQMGERQEIFARRKSGEEFPAEASIAKLTVGLEHTYTVVLRDVSQRKATEDELRRSEERIRLAVEEGRIGLFEHDHGTGQSYWSPIYRDIFGLAEDRSACAAAYLERIHPDDLAAVERAVAAAIAPNGDGVFNLDHRIVKPDREVRWVSVNARTHFNGTGADRRPHRTIGAVRDITEPKTLEVRLQQRVAERTAELSAVLDAVPDAVLTKDNERLIRSANATLTTLFGYRRNEIVGMPADQLYASPKDNDDVVHAWAGWEGEGPKVPVMVKCRRKDGTTFSARVLGNAVRARNGRIVSRVGVIRDMTDELMRQNIVVQAQRMEALGQLTGGIAHDSNNLLTVIAGNLEMLEEELAGHPGMKYLREAQEAAQMGARLNQRLLTFARRRRLEPQVVNLNDQVLAMSELLRRTIGETIKLTTVLAHDLGATRVDPSEVESAVLNLAINARDAMPQGGNLRIETTNMTVDADISRIEKGLQPGAYVRLSVSDTGCGMPPEIVARVFEPFFTTKAPGKGTGLGLATIFGFVIQSNGHVGVYSEVGQGTTIHLYLPRLLASDALRASGSASDPLPLAQGETILVVEDNPQVRTLTVERLRRLGYHVRDAENGPTALALLDAGQTAHLVFSDVVMPGGLSGFDLARSIVERTPGQRILLTSGFAEDMARGNDRSLADQHILRKPYSLAELASAIRRALDKPVPQDN
jgi:PAS domain S-box-containing protein